MTRRSPAPPTRTIEHDVPITDLIPWPGNPRSGNIPVIRESMRANGWFGVVIRQKSTGWVCAGNHRIQAWAEEGNDTIPDVQTLDIDDAKARRILLIDNRSSDLASYDGDKLTAMLRDALADDLAGTGYGEDEVLGWLKQIDQQATPEGILEREASKRTMEEFDTGSDGQTRYEDQDVRNIVLPFTAAVFTEVIDRLAFLAEKWGYDTNAEVVARLTADAYEAAQ